MTNTVKLVLVPVGVVIGGMIALALKQVGILSPEFDGRWIAIALALGGLILGHHFDNKRECARIARELEQDRIRAEKDGTRQDPSHSQRAVETSLAEPLEAGRYIMNDAPGMREGVGGLLFSQSGVTPFLIIVSLLGGILLITFSGVFFVRFEDTFIGGLTLIIGCLVLLPFISGCLRKVQCYQNGIIVRKWWKREFVAIQDICAIRYYALSKGISGTACVLELVPLHSKTVKFEVFGSVNDSLKAWKLVQIIRHINPRVEMVQY